MRRSTLLAAVLVSVWAGCLAPEPAQQVNALNSLGEDTPVYFTAPAAGFNSSGTVDVTVWVAKGYCEQSILDPHGGPKGPGYVVVHASVEGCTTVAAANILTDGAVAPLRENGHTKAYLWTVTLDLTACQCQGGGTVRTHHCDGCGHTFDTCEDGGATCAASAVTIVVDAFNQPGNNKCTLHDFDGDGTTDCDVVSGALSPAGGGGGETEEWVPPPFWTDDNTVCVRRAGPNNECHPVGNAGGHSCD
jgi:hypothetical protein